jgi:hypothetical protein
VTRSWDSTKGAVSTPLTASNSIAITHEYGTWNNGATGRLDRTFDANNVATRFIYGDLGNGVVDLYVTKTIAAEGTAVARTSESKYDFYTGVANEAKDTDNNLVTKTTLDVFGRPTLVQEAFGTALERRTSMEYADTLRRVITRTDKDATGDGLLISVRHYDQLGRIRLARSLENGVASDAYDETKGVKVQTRYFSGNGTNPNAYTLVSNPYRAATASAAGSEYTMGWTRQKHDQAGRMVEIQTFGGATLPAPWSTNNNGTGTVVTQYDAERTLVTDQATKKRLSETDALGRLSRVWELTPSDGATVSVSFPGHSFNAGYVTQYAYNTLDSLTTVTQQIGTSGTTQTRSFAYSSLNRLTSATNPESGTITYQY